MYRKTEKGKYNISSALDSRGTNLEKTPWEGTLIFVAKLGKDKTD